MAFRDSYASGVDADVGPTVDAATCPECGGALATEGGETTCVECGLIVDAYRIDHAATPRTDPADGQQRTRTGAPLTPTLHDRGLSTEIGRRRDANGDVLPAAKRHRLNRQRRYHSRAKWASKADRNLGRGCSEIARMTSALELSYSVRERASAIFRRAQQAGLLQGRSIESIAAASVHAACRCRGVNRPLDEIAAVARCEEAAVTNAYGVLNVDLELETALVTPRSVLPRIASACDAPAEVRARAVALVDLADEAGIANGRTPSGVAAGALYLADQEHGAGLTQVEIAEAAGTTPVTLRARYEELQAVRE